MRTTLDLPDDVHAAVRSVARDRGTTMSAAAADLLRRALGQGGTVEVGRSAVTSPPTVRVGRAVTLDDVRSLEDDA